jgi:DNA-binding transcriptional ArsR family regulator
MAQSPQVELLKDPRQIQALAQPVRVALLDALREPNTAAGASRAMGKTRQQVNYHLKELERVGLVRRTGERRKGNFMEQLYQAIARRFVIAPDFAWNKETLAATLKDQVSLAQLSSLGEQIQRDATALIDRAAYEGAQIPSASVQADVQFTDEEARGAFLDEYFELLKALLKKHGSRKGSKKVVKNTERFHVAFTAYPQVEDD